MPEQGGAGAAGDIERSLADHLRVCADRGGVIADDLWLWIEDLDGPAPPWVTEGGGLDAAERARLARLPTGLARARLLRGRGLLRAALAGPLGCTPGAVRLEVGPGGRPALIGPGPSFNLSHSGRWLVLAVALPRGGQAPAAVGVDVEQGPALGESSLLTRFGDDVQRVVFTDVERAWVGAAPDPGAAALRLWTRKEAALKAVGAGLRLSAQALEAHGGALRWGPGLRALDGAWRLIERPLPEGGWCTIAARGG